MDPELASVLVALSVIVHELIAMKVNKRVEVLLGNGLLYSDQSLADQMVP